MNPSAQNRLHYLDAMRSVLMLLGVVLHSARPYSGGTWRVNDAQTLPALDKLTWGLHLFRMPAFFVIAGFFAMYLIGRRTTSAFLQERLRRVLVPLVVMMLTVNVAQVWFIARHVHHDDAPFLTGVLLPELASGGMSSHLWFLACLAVYFLLTAALAPVLRGILRLDADWAPRTTALAGAALVAGAIALGLAGEVAAKFTGGLMQISLLGLVKTAVVLDYLPYFGVGLLLGALPRVYERFSRLSLAVPVVAGIAGIGLVLCARQDGMVQKLGYMVSYALLAWMAIRVLFAGFARFASQPSPLFRYLSAASYSVYLFHHIIVIVLALLLIPVALPVLAKFLLVLTGASVISLAVYHFVVRPSALMTFLFNGTLPPAMPLAVPLQSAAPHPVAPAPVADAEPAPVGPKRA